MVMPPRYTLERDAAKPEWTSVLGVWPSDSSLGRHSDVREDSTLHPPIDQDDRRHIWWRLRFRRVFGGVDTYPHGQVLTLVGVTRIAGRLVLLSEQIIKSR